MAKQKNQKTDLLQLVKIEVQKSLLLDSAEKKHWLAEAKTMPISLLTHFLKILTEENAQIQTFIKKAIDTDPNISTALKEKIASTKKRILTLKEKEDTTNKNAETYLESQLKQA